MKMAIAHKGAISFGLVYIPVNLYTATQDNDISFNQLHKADHSRIRYKKVCAHCGKEVKPEDITKGFQYEKDQYVTVSDEEIEKIKTEKDRTIQILQFSNLDQISPIYYDRAYHVAPEGGGEKALELLRAAMMESQKVALGKTVFGSHEKLLIIIPREDGMLIQTLMYQDDIKEMPKSYEKVSVGDAELKMAKQLIESMDQPFDPQKYRDEFQDKLKKLISEKIAGKEIKTAKSEAPGKIINLLDALKASVEQNKGKKPAKGKGAGAKAAKDAAEAPAGKKRKKA